MEYFVSAAFFHTLVLIALACALVLMGRSFDAKILKAKGEEQRRLKNIKLVLEIFKFAMLVIDIYLIMVVNGVNVGKVMKSLGIASIVVGFALNDYLKDIVMGITILIEGYYKVGDSVVYQGRIGKVVSFNVKTTKIFMYDTEETMIICNRNIVEISKASDWVDINIPLGYDLDPTYARAICRKCAKRIERLKYVYSCDFLNTQEFEASYISYKLRIHHLVEKQYMVKRNSNSVVQDVLHEHGVAFPYGVAVLYDGEALEAKSKNLPIEAVLPERRFDGKDYELGHGADKSKVVSFDGSSAALEKAIKETERYSRSENLNKKMELRVRLLAEETLLLVQGIEDIREGNFYILRDDADYEIVLDATAILSKENKKTFKHTKKVPEDESAGVGNTIIHAINAMVAKYDRYAKGEDALHNAMDDSIVKTEKEYGWSYNVYKEKEDEEKTYEELMESDALEQSVLTSFADDIKISMSNNKLKIRVLVKNIDEDE